MAKADHKYFPSLIMTADEPFLKGIQRGEARTGSQVAELRRQIMNNIYYSYYGFFFCKFLNENKTKQNSVL